MRKFFKILFIIILFVLVIYVFYHFICLNHAKLEKNTSQNLENSPFSISKIMVYSSAYGKNKDTTFQQSNWILDLFQYSDIALYIDNGKSELNAQNTIKNLWIENIKIIEPKIGSPSLYYLDSLNFGTANFNEQNIINKKLDFTVLNDTNIDNNLQYNTPTFFADCSNPITLKYVNQSIKNNYQITSNEPVFFNGKLLEMANIPLEHLKSTIQFTICLVNYNHEEFFYDFSLPLELENTKHTIFEGNLLTQTSFENKKFIKKF